MQCLRPIFAYDCGKRANGKKIVKFSSKIPRDPDFILPCGKCDACLANKRRDWISRACMELFTSVSSCFITLTYNQDNLPSSGKLQKHHLQGFFKRLRNVFRDFHLLPEKIRYFACGEYGKLHLRPHYHAIVYGVDFMRPEFKPFPALVKSDGNVIWSSKVLEHYWPYGFVSVDKVSSSNIKYVSKYITKRDGMFICSQGLGRSLFVDVRRSQRHVDYIPKPFLFSSAHNDLLVLDNKRLPFPRFAIRYLERFPEFDLESFKQKRRDFLKGKHTDLTCPSVRQAYMLHLNRMDEIKARRSLDECC